jgi:hypothetical protein
MKPRRLVWVTNDTSLQVPEIPTGLVKKRIPVPRRGVKIPKVRHYKEESQIERTLFLALSEILNRFWAVRGRGRKPPTKRAC